MTDTKLFTNGFRSWMETFYEVVAKIETIKDVDETTLLNHNEVSVVTETHSKEGTCGLVDLAEQWTDDFELKNKGRIWDGEFFDEIDDFCDQKNLEA